MSVFLAWLGVAMFAIGISAIYSGSLVFTFERGWTMVISGTVAGSAGAILIGLSAALRRLQRIELEAVKLREVIASFSGSRPAELPREPAETPAPADILPRLAEAIPPAPPVDTPPEPDKIVGTYQAGGSSYVMFADGSIRAQTPSGEHRFASMDAFKAFMLSSALRPEPEKPGKPDVPVQASDSPTALSAKA